MAMKMKKKRESERVRRGGEGLTIEMSKRETILCRGQQDWTTRLATMAYDACSHGAGTVEQEPDERP